MGAEESGPRLMGLEVEANRKAKGSRGLIAVRLTIPAVPNGSRGIDQLLRVVSGLIRLIGSRSVIES